MIPKEYMKIFLGLVERTASGKLAWDQGPSGGTYLASMGTFSVVVSDYEDYGHRGVTFSIRDDNGMEIDSFAIEAGDRGFVEALNLFKMARRRAMRIDEAIKQMESILGVASITYSDDDLSDGHDSTAHDNEESGNREEDDLPF